ncbi:MAG: hypothetical protein J7M03_01245, partial [Candidatus Desulfofervidaceae bacterium]|nr:hypothetical protein [Candidatus Desulfofervidaceae bacterium]
IPLLIEHFIRKYNVKFNKKVTGISQEALGLLYQYHWPGNVRELENYIERAVLLAPRKLITSKELPYYLLGTTEEIREKNLDEIIEGIEKRLIIDALRKTHGVQTRAAEILGISERSLWHRVKKYGIKAKDFKNR